MPTYNHALHIRRAVDSVLRQSYTNWELIVWDDGSTDNTGDIVGLYSDDRIYYRFDDNHGPSYARNRSAELARGDYLAFLDSDDEWMNGKLSAQVKVMDAYPQIDLLFADYMNVNAGERRTARAFVQCSGAMKLLDVERIDDGLFIVKGGILQSLAVDDYVLPSAALLRRSATSAAGVFNEHLRGPEDFELLWRMGLTGVRFAYLDQPYLTRYKYANSLSSPSMSHCQNWLAALGACRRTGLS